MPVTIADATAEIRKYEHGLKAMKGGFTLSGGEPLMQARFAARLFAAARQLGVHTAIETNGFYGEKLSDDDLNKIDLVILDMKGFTPEQHKRVTAVSDNAQVLAFARRLSALRRPMWLRFVLVPGLTDVADEMEKIADFGASLEVVERAEILPFHQMGRFKWQKLGLNYELTNTEPPSIEAVTHAEGIFRKAGLNVV
jgi:pyruvate formate lyase activating enzyme